MAFDINSMRTDRSAETEGTWIDYTGGLRLKIARLNNDKHQQAMIHKQREYRRNNRIGQSDDLSAERLRELTIESIADYILLDWENMVEGGVAIKYSKAEAMRLLREIPEFYRLVEDESMNIANFRIEQEAAELGNSNDSATGGGDGVTLSPHSES